MTILSRVEINVRAAASDTTALDINIGTGGGTGAGDVDVAVSTAVAGLGVNIGLDQLLRTESPVEHLLNGPDALARFRAGAVPADPSPVATRGMTIRAGDPYAEVATRYAVAAVGLTAATARAEVAARFDDGGVAGRVAVGTDNRATAAVRDPAAAAVLPQRIDGSGGTTALNRGIDVAAITGPVPILGGPASGRLTAALIGLVDVLGQAVLTPHDAIPGTVLTYLRADGTVVAELRTATGFAGAAAASALPLSVARSHEAYVLNGAFVRPDAVPPPPDGSTIPAGQPLPPAQHRATDGDGDGGHAATDRPYIHAIWYDILALRFAAAGVNLTERTAALRDVVWAIALEHGPFAEAHGTDVLGRVERRIDLPRADDAAIIAALFEERGRLAPGGDLVRYPDVPPGDRARVVIRLAGEAAVALNGVSAG